MKGKMIGCVICCLVLVSTFSCSAQADPETELKLAIVGGVPLPLLFQQVTGIIQNLGETPAYNVSYLVDISGGLLDGIHVTFDGTKDQIPSEIAFSVATRAVYGFGLVTVTFTASASNADEVSLAAKGFQLGSFTWIPFSWVKLFRSG
jgi:hypothetical protein